MPYHAITAGEVPEFLVRQAPVVLDMRDPASFARGHITGAQPVSETLIGELRRKRAFEKPLLLYCYHGISSRDLAAFLVALGFRQVFNLEGGWQAWESLTAPPAPEPSESLNGWYAANGFAEAHPACRGARGMTPLMQACLNGEMEIVEELLAAGSDLGQVNDDGNTALWFACKGDHTSIMRRLIQSGIDIDHRNPDGVSCLIYAASAGKLEVVQTLLAAGADPQLATVDGFTALDCAASLPVLRLLRPRPAASSPGRA